VSIHALAFIGTSSTPFSQERTRDAWHSSDCANVSGVQRKMIRHSSRRSGVIVPPITEADLAPASFDLKPAENPLAGAPPEGCRGSAFPSSRRQSGQN